LIVVFVSSSGGGHPANRIRHRHGCHRRRRRRDRRHRRRCLLPPPPRDLFDCCVHVHRRLLMLSPRSLAPVA